MSEQPRFVNSADGTPIACWWSGEGPPIVLVHGTTGDHNSFALAAPLLAERFSVCLVDRRGRGASGDTEPYDLDREFEDLAAVVDSVGEPAVLLGHSYGGDCALGASLIARNLRALILYEPSAGVFGAREEDVERIEASLAGGDRESALITTMRDVVGASDLEVQLVRSSPLWPLRMAAAHTVPRELRSERTHKLDPAAFRYFDVPTLVLVGTRSPAWAVAGSRAVAEGILGARLLELEGQGHSANLTSPRQFADAVREFVEELPD